MNTNELRDVSVNMASYLEWLAQDFIDLSDPEVAKLWEEDKKKVIDALERLFAHHTQREVTAAEERGAIRQRDWLSTYGRPLSAPPEVIKQPVPCPRCGAKEYPDWTLYPHQVYNSYMPGGIGHYCFPCFAAIVSERELKALEDKEQS